MRASCAPWDGYAIYSILLLVASAGAPHFGDIGHLCEVAKTMFDVTRSLTKPLPASRPVIKTTPRYLGTLRYA